MTNNMLGTPDVWTWVGLDSCIQDVVYWIGVIYWGGLDWMQKID